MNLSLSGDAFDIINKIKNALELACPGIVSCSDIVVQATRDLVKMVGGPFYPVRLGRKDSLESDAKKVDASVPRPNMTMDDIIKRYVAVMIFFFYITFIIASLIYRLFLKLSILVRSDGSVCLGCGWLINY